MCVTLVSFSLTLSLSLSKGVSSGQKTEVIQCSEVMTGQLTQERKRQIEGEIKRGRDVGHFPIVSESLLWNTHAQIKHTYTHSQMKCTHTHTRASAHTHTLQVECVSESLYGL